MPQTNWSGYDEGPGGDDNHYNVKDDEDFGWGLENGIVDWKFGICDVCEDSELELATEYKQWKKGWSLRIVDRHWHSGIGNWGWLV